MGEEDFWGKLQNSFWAPLVLCGIVLLFGLWFFLRSNNDSGKALVAPKPEPYFVLVSIRHPETKDVLLQFRVNFDTQPVVGNAKWLNSVYYVQDKTQAWADSVYLEHKMYMAQNEMPISLIVPELLKQFKQKGRR